MKDNHLTSLTDLHIPGLLQPGVFQQAKPVALTHAPLTGPQAYYRSKVISSVNGINPLTAAATALITFVVQFQTTYTYFDSNKIYQDLVHEIRAFEAQAHTQGYRSEIILLARYILCSVLDEIILISPWGEQSQWYKHKLLSTFHGEDWGGERFFTILERLSADSAIHIDLLELIYICLSLGYAGKYRLSENNQTELDEIIEKLYQCIYYQRGDVRKDLAICEQAVQSLPVLATETVTQTSQPLPFWLLGIFTVMLMLTIYAGFNFMLNSSITPVYQQLTSILQNYADS
jgi:type IV/VI secretion system ImpK/VasF family protein